MTYTDYYMPMMVDYSVYAMIRTAKGLAATEKNILLGPTCTWTVEMSSSSAQGWNGGALSFVNGAGNEVARLSLESTQATRSIKLPLGHVEVRWEKPDQAIEDFRFVIRNADGTAKVHFHSSSSEIHNGILYVANNTCNEKDEEEIGTLLTATISGEQVTLNWDEIDNSINYQIFRDGLLYGMTTETSFVDDDTRATFHTYHVTAFTTNGEVLPSNTCSYHPESPCAIPTNLRVEIASGKAKLTWDAPDDETVAGYMVYRRPKGGEFKRIKLLTATTYTDNFSGQPDDWYEYTVSAYYRESQCESGYASVEGHPELNFVEFNRTIIPTHLDFLIHEGHVILQWKEGTTAEGYNVYRNGERIAHNVTGDSFIDYSATSQQSYHYYITGRTAHLESNPSNIVFVDWTTNTNENTDSQNISIYPNPTESSVTIEAVGLRQIRVFNVTGQEVKCQTTLDSHITVDLSTQPKGCYFIEATTEQGCTTAKIVKL